MRNIEIIYVVYVAGVKYCRPSRQVVGDLRQWRQRDIIVMLQLLRLGRIDLLACNQSYLNMLKVPFINDRRRYVPILHEGWQFTTPNVDSGGWRIWALVNMSSLV